LEKKRVFLGYVVSDEGIKVDLKKIATVIEWPSPKSITLLRGYLDISMYYRRFVRIYAQIVAPLITLLKKDAFKWNDEAEACFIWLKLLMMSTPVLSTPYFSKTIVLECDASRDGLGVVLMQDNDPITFESQKFESREQTKSTYDKELLEIMHALVKWKQYLLRMKFLMKMDHNSLKYFLT
jgi:hypothetical protein